jgi:hypothetical protein
MLTAYPEANAQCKECDAVGRAFKAMRGVTNLDTDLTTAQKAKMLHPPTFETDLTGTPFVSHRTHDDQDRVGSALDVPGGTTTTISAYPCASPGRKVRAFSTPPTR